MTRRSVLVLGSTGSIGVQTLDVVAANPDRFEVAGVAAGGADPAALAAQAIASGARAIAVSRSTAAEDVQLALYAEAKRRGYERGGFPSMRGTSNPFPSSSTFMTMASRRLASTIFTSRAREWAATFASAPCSTLYMAVS